MKSATFLFFLLPICAIVLAEETFTPYQMNQVEDILNFLKEANSSIFEMLQAEEPAPKNCPGTIDIPLSRLLESLVLKFGEIDWQSLMEEVEPINATKTVPELIAMWSYPVEVHEITTEDGYILTAHRIPYGRDCGPSSDNETKSVVFLQHGLLGDSSNWVITGPRQRGLAYWLADQCFDVWMGNYRGNTYSRNHKTLNPDSSNLTEVKQFYTFSFHELGIYDLSASIDYVLRVTGAKKLHYVGHSMGTTGMFVLLSEKPEYNDRIADFSALAPVTAIKHMRALIRVIACPALRNWFIDRLNDRDYYEVLPIRDTLPIAGICKIPVLQEICATVMYFAGGWSPNQMDYIHLGWITEHSPAGTSQGTIIHYAQTYEREVFSKYDYGEGNKDKYNQDDPPEYDLSKIKVPIGLFWSDNDLLADRRDVSILRTTLGANVNLDYKVPDNLFNHLDYVFGKDQMTLVYEPLLQFILTPNKTIESSAAPKIHSCHALLLPLAAIILSKVLNHC